MTLGENLRRIRNKSGISQSALADRVGVSLHTIFRVENGKTQPRASDIKKLCNVLNVTKAELLNGPVVAEFRVTLKYVKTLD
jgi:transcriptional regulator with XRE-family HTH domain